MAAADTPLLSGDKQRLESTVIDSDMRKRSTRNATKSTYAFIPTPDSSRHIDLPETSQLLGSTTQSSSTSRVSSWSTRTRLALYNRIETIFAPLRADIEGALKTLLSFLTDTAAETFYLIKEVLKVLYHFMLNYCRTPFAIIITWYLLFYIGGACWDWISEAVSSQYILKASVCYATNNGLTICGVDSTSRIGTSVSADEQIKYNTRNTQLILEHVMTIENMPYAMLESWSSLRSLAVAVEESDLLYKKDLSSQLWGISKVSKTGSRDLTKYMYSVSKWVQQMIHAIDRVTDELKEIIKKEEDHKLYTWDQVLLYPLGLHSKPTWNLAEASAIVFEKHFQDLKDEIITLRDLGEKLHQHVKDTESSIQLVDRLFKKQRIHLEPNNRVLRFFAKLVNMPSRDEELVDRVGGEWRTVEHTLRIILDGLNRIEDSLEVAGSEIGGGHLKTSQGTGEQLPKVIDDIRLAVEPLREKKKEEERQMKALVDQMGKPRYRSHVVETRLVPDYVSFE